MGERTHLKKRGTERGARGRVSTTQPRERGAGAERVVSSRAASAHGGEEKLWESKQRRRIPVCFQPLAGLTGDYKDECAGPGSVIKTDLMGGYGD